MTRYFLQALDVGDGRPGELIIRRMWFVEGVTPFGRDDPTRPNLITFGKIDEPLGLVADPPARRVEEVLRYDARRDAALFESDLDASRHWHDSGEWFEL